eukprot:CAMPEP_0172878758 /NCGR_PEP_ID=MMETSP1075-20121228/110550_1 /TAXON_ID=2916 /ORGANISM="Ceratium fusus, Strain PA161109" /LENGTH=34 /DNA_ID= /DNA_START= /DNA_END= /DNA_ORIENTATION=
MSAKLAICSACALSTFFASAIASLVRRKATSWSR